MLGLIVFLAFVSASYTPAAYPARFLLLITLLFAAKSRNRRAVNTLPINACAAGQLGTNALPQSVNANMAVGGESFTEPSFTSGRNNRMTVAHRHPVERNIYVDRSAVKDLIEAPFSALDRISPARKRGSYPRRNRVLSEVNKVEYSSRNMILPETNKAPYSAVDRISPLSSKAVSTVANSIAAEDTNKQRDRNDRASVNVVDETMENNVEGNIRKDPKGNRQNTSNILNDKGRLFVSEINEDPPAVEEDVIEIIKPNREAAEAAYQKSIVSEIRPEASKGFIPLEDVSPSSAQNQRDAKEEAEVIIKPKGRTAKVKQKAPEYIPYDDISLYMMENYRGANVEVILKSGTVLTGEIVLNFKEVIVLKSVTMTYYINKNYIAGFR